MANIDSVSLGLVQGPVQSATESAASGKAAVADAGASFDKALAKASSESSTSAANPVQVQKELPKGEQKIADAKLSKNESAGTDAAKTKAVKKQSKQQQELEKVFKDTQTKKLEEEAKAAKENAAMEKTAAAGVVTGKESQQGLTQVEQLQLEQQKSMQLQQQQKQKPLMDAQKGAQGNTPVNPQANMQNNGLRNAVHHVKGSELQSAKSAGKNAPQSQPVAQASVAPQQQTTVLQPIIMPVAMSQAMPQVMPQMMSQMMMMPVDVIEVEPDMSGQLAGMRQNQARGMINSEDFVARHPALQAVKNAQRDSRMIDPRMFEATDASAKYDTVAMSPEAWNLMMPQVSQQTSGQVTDSGSTQTLSQALSRPVQVDNSAQIAGHVFGLANRGGGSVKVKVAPHHLGELTITVHNDRGKLNVRLDASSNEARELIAANATELKSVLGAARYDVAGIEVNATRGKQDGMSTTSGWSQMGSGDFSGSGRDSQGWDSRGGNGNNGSAWDRYFNQTEDFLSQNQGRRQGSGNRRAFDEYGMSA